MIVDCIADLHGNYPELEGGDLLILAGDLTAFDTIACWDGFFKWFNAQDYRKKIYIAGNHDNFLSICSNNVDCADIVYGPECEKQEYLRDSGTEFEGLKIWGSPWTNSFNGMNPECMAFTCDTDEELSQKWALIPTDIDILITHSPPVGNLDHVKNKGSVGSLSLWMISSIIKPKLHVFGHIHEGYGECVHHNGMHLVNCSHVNKYYDPVNKPIRVIL